MLRATAITHRFGAATVLDSVDFDLDSGELIGICGASGTGKSTLGRILAGHLRPNAGRVTLDGVPVAPLPGAACPVQYAPQMSELSLDPRWRVERILRNGGDPDPMALRLLGVDPAWAGRFPAELSGGELARVSLARLVLPSTRCLICDEITAPLDALAAEVIMTALVSLARQGLGIVLIGHDTRLLDRYTQRLLLLSGGRLAPPDSGRAGGGTCPVSTS